MTLLCDVINLRGRTQTLVSPFMRLQAAPMLGWRANEKDHSGEKECIWLGWIGEVRQEAEAASDLPCRHLQVGLSPNEPRPPFCETTANHQGSLWEVCEVCVIGWRRWSGSLMTQIWSWLSLITLALYIHPIRMNSALHKSTREKYWFYTIHFLKYIQSKISYVSIMSCSQSAPMCNYMHFVCERIPEYPIYITQLRVSKGSYLFG